MSNISVGGGLQVADSLIRLIRVSESISHYLLVSHRLAEVIDLDAEIFSDYILITTNQKCLIPYNKTTRKIRQIEHKFDPDVVFTLFGPAYWKANSPHLVGFARPHYLIKNSPFFTTISIRKRLYFLFMQSIHGILFRRNSDYLFVENKKMVSDLSRKYGKKVFYVPNTYHQVFSSFDKIPEKKMGTFKLLTVSANYDHKNLKIIPKVAMVLVRRYPDFQFEFTITVENLPGISSEIEDRFKFIGLVSVKECAIHYKNADVMLLPTLLECFSASYVESMKSGVPILTSKMDFAQAICGEAALYFDPLSPEQIASCIYKLANDNSLYTDLVIKGKEQLEEFGSPSDRLDSFIEIFHSICHEN